jgi:hypothetical protein
MMCDFGDGHRARCPIILGKRRGEEERKPVEATIPKQHL